MSRRSESWTLLALISCCLVINFATITRSPTVWIDEVSYIDPGVNLALGNGFTSSAWYSQTKDKFWAGNTPLYPLLVAGWIKVVGFGMPQVRSLNLLLITLAALALWRGMIAGRLFSHATTRLAAIALFLFGYSLTFVYRSGRPDTVSVLLFSLLFLALAIESRRFRLGALALGSFLMPFAGLSALPYLALCGCLWLWLRGKAGLLEFVTVGVASAAGLVALLGTYAAVGVLADFRASTSGHSTLVLASEGLAVVFGRWADTLWNFRGDLSLLLLLSGLVAAQAFVAVVLKRGIPRPTIVLTVFAVLTPVVMLLVGTFPIYYGWMAYVPLVFAWAVWFDSAIPGRRPALIHFGLGGLAALAILAGLPLRTTIAVSQWEDRDYAPVHRLARSAVLDDDVVFCSPQAYYAVKGRAATTYSGSYSQVISAEEKQGVTILLTDPKELEKLAALVGGEWTPITPELAVTSQRRTYGANTYNVQAWRRVR